MRFLFKGLLILGLILLLVGGAFSLYAHFLMDYSLDRLTFAVSATSSQDISTDHPSPLAQKVYKSLVEDLSIEEASQEKLEYQNLVLLDLATRSLEEVDDRAGYARAKVYLSQLVQKKKPVRNKALLAADELTRKVLGLYQSSAAFVKYAIRNITQEAVPEKVSIGDYASTLLLNQAEENEKQGEMAEAIEDYKKFLKVYSYRKEKNLVSLTLANLFLKQRNYGEAETVLREIQNAVPMTEEGQLASRLMQKIGFLKEKEALIVDLNRELAAKTNPQEKEIIEFKLGLASIATYQIARGQALFEKLAKSQNQDLKKRSQFYLAWIYKLSDQEQKSVELFTKLLEDPSINRDFELGLRAQLADAFYRVGKVDQSIQQFDVLSRRARDRKKAFVEIGREDWVSWVSFSELEQVHMYYFDKNDLRKAKDHLRFLAGGVQGDIINFRDLEFKLEEATRINLRDLAFRALIEKKLNLALDLFMKQLQRDPNDALNLTGLATVYVLLGDLDSAHEYAKRGYQLEESEYPALMLGYVLSLRGEYTQAIKLYKEAMARNPGSVAAQFNLAYVFLRMAEFRSALKLLKQLEETIGPDEDKRFIRSKAYNNMAYAYWGIKDLVRAEKYFMKALEITPDFAIAKKNLALLKAGETPRSTKFYE